MRKPPDPHYRHRFPAELISHAVWLYHVFSLSFRDVELILAERGVIVSYESVRQELPGRACHRLQDLDRGDVRPKRRVTALWSQPPARTRPWTVKLTMPARRLCHSRDQTLKSHRTASHRRQDATARAACSITSTTTSGKVTGMAWEEFTSVT
jgi:hypothetical protein